MKHIAFLTAFLFLAGCQTNAPFPSNCVSLTSVADSATVAYVKLFRSGLIPDATATQIAERHLNMRQAIAVARESYVIYKAGGPMSNLERYNLSMNAAQESAQAFIALLLPFLSPMDSIALQSRLQAANCP